MKRNLDYRNTSTCKPLVKVKEKKACLHKKIVANHPKTKIIYNKIKDRKNKYFREFLKIYNEKCAYCSITTKSVGQDRMEIDHFINEGSFSDCIDGRVIAGKVENLVLACSTCNGNKNDFYIETMYQSILNPDDGSIARVFYRCDEYYIKINNDYINDNFIQIFYEQIKFGAEIRRLDYLLLEMENFAQILDSTNPIKANELYKYIFQLTQRRNLVLNTWI